MLIFGHNSLIVREPLSKLNNYCFLAWKDGAYGYLVKKWRMNTYGKRGRYVTANLGVFYIGQAVNKKFSY